MRHEYHPAVQADYDDALDYDEAAGKNLATSRHFSPIIDLDAENAERRRGRKAEFVRTASRRIRQSAKISSPQRHKDTEKTNG